MIQQIWSIGRNTFIESIRQPIFSVVILATGLVLVLSPSIAAYTMEDDNKLLVDMGLSTLGLAGLLLAAFTATGVLSREIENRTVLTVVSKPVARPVFVLGKFAGVTAAIVLAYWSLSMIFLLVVRHRVMMTASDRFDLPVILLGTFAGAAALGGAAMANYLYGRVFTSSFILSLATGETLAFLLVLFINSKGQFQWPTAEFAEGASLMEGQLPVALLLVLEVVLIITAVAIAASTRLGQVMTLLICFLAFVLGLVSNAVFGQYAHGNVIAMLLYSLTPNVHFLWPADLLTQGLDLTARYVAWVSGYSVLFIGAILSLAVALFQTREVG